MVRANARISRRSRRKTRSPFPGLTAQGIKLESGCHVLKHFEQVVGDLGSSKESHKRPERSSTLNHTSNIIMTAL